MSAGIVGFVAGALAGGIVGAAAMALLAAGPTTDEEDMASAYCIGYGDGIHARRPHPERAATLTRATSGRVSANEGGWREVR